MKGMNQETGKAMETEAVDLMDLAKELPKRQRGRACIILTRNYPQQKAWATKLAGLVGVDHLNLLDELADADPTFKMAGLSVDGLFKYLENRSESPLLIVSGLEFIKATWAYNPRRTMGQLAQQVEMWSRKPALLFVTQYDTLLAKMKFSRFSNLRFVVDQQNTISL